MRGEAPLSGMAVGPDGRVLGTGDGARGVRTGLLRPADLIDEVCRRLARNLTPEKWSEFLGSESLAPTCADLDQHRRSGRVGPIRTTASGIQLPRAGVTAAQSTGSPRQHAPVLR